jgi:5-methylcytosine-specific restriction endonuclease McrA
MPYKDPAQAKARYRAYHLAHREERLTKNAARYAATPPEERRAYARAYRATHAEKLCIYREQHQEERRAYNTKYAATHAEQERARKAKYRAEHVEERRVYRAAYRAAHLGQELANDRAYAAAHPGEKRIRQAAWRKARPEVVAASKQRRRARKANAPVNDLTAAQWLAIKAHYGYRCVYCGRKMQRLTQDHITPFEKGGSHTLHNVVPACKPCNSKKGVKAPLIPIQPLLLL